MTINEKKLKRIIAESVKNVIKEAQQYNTLSQMKEVYDLAKQYGLAEIANFIAQRMNSLQSAQNQTGNTNNSYGSAQAPNWGRMGVANNTAQVNRRQSGNMPMPQFNNGPVGMAKPQFKTPNFNNTNR